MNYRPLSCWAAYKSHLLPKEGRISEISRNGSIYYVCLYKLHPPKIENFVIMKELLVVEHNNPFYFGRYQIPGLSVQPKQLPLLLLLPIS